MPLDAAISPHQRGNELARAALNAGIIPLPMAVLETHKAAELAKHPGSLVGRHPGALRIASCVAMLGCLAAGLGLSMLQATATNFAYVAITELLILAAVVGILVASAVQFKGPAEWRSRFSRQLGNDVPAPFRDMAWAIMHQVPDCQAEVGELVQKNVVLDPYLVIHHRSSPSPLVIGIWDGDQIIASAMQIEV